MNISKGRGISESEIFFVRMYEEGVISVNTDGLIFNNKTNRYIGATGSGRYPKISMARNNRYDIRHIQIHRLVWIIFEGDIPEDKVLNHMDGDTENRSLSNLEVVSDSENSYHAYMNGLSTNFPAHENGNAKFTKEQVLNIRERVLKGEFQSHIAKEYNVSKTTINLMIKGKTYKY